MSCYYRLMSMAMRLLLVIVLLLLLLMLLLVILLLLLLLASLTIVCATISLSTSTTNLIISNSLLINPHALPTLYAVSILSPVNIHTFIFALSKSLIVYGTSSCRSSCTAVAPNKNKFCSSSYCNFYTYF